MPLPNSMKAPILIALLFSCATIDPSETAREPVHREAHAEVFELSGHGFEIAHLETGSKAFSNRRYVWLDIPDRFEGVPYTHVAGGVPSTMSVFSDTPGTVYVASRADRMLDLGEMGWNLEPIERDTTFAYNSTDRQLMVLMSHPIGASESLVIPQLGWAGTLVLFIAGV